MNLFARERGVVAVYANRDRDPSRVFAELQASVADFKTNHQAQLAAMNGQIDTLNAQLAAMKIGGGGDGPSQLPSAARNAMTEFLRTGNAQSMLDQLPRNAMSTDSAPDGGFTIPMEIDNTIQAQMIALSPMRAAASVVTVGTSDYHKLINRRGATTGWAGETDPQTETGTPQLADIVPPMGELWAYPSITQWALDDSQFDLGAFIQENISDEFALQEGASFVTGDGIKKPMGLLQKPVAATPDETRPFGTLQYIPSGKADGFKETNPADTLIDMVYSVKAVYRAGEGVGWQMNSKTAGVIRKFKDGDGNFIWQQALTAGQPSLLCGYPVWENEDFPDIGANAFPVAFGNFRKGYLIVDRMGTKVLRDPYTKPGWLKIYVSKRVGGTTTDTRAIKLLKISLI